MLTEDGKHLYVSYDEYHNLIEKLAIKVHQSGWEFDTILCLARGGMRPGDVLSRIFDKPLAIMSTSSYRADAGTVQGHLDIARFITTPKGEIAGKVLLVDDLADSGHTLHAVVEMLKSNYKPITELRSAVLWTKALSTFTPDYSVEFLPTNPWIHQPFEGYDSHGRRRSCWRSGRSRQARGRLAGIERDHEEKPVDSKRDEYVKASDYDLRKQALNLRVFVDRLRRRPAVALLLAVSWLGLGVVIAFAPSSASLAFAARSFAGRWRFWHSPEPAGRWRSCGVRCAATRRAKGGPASRISASRCSGAAFRRSRAPRCCAPRSSGARRDRGRAGSFAVELVLHRDIDRGARLQRAVENGVRIVDMQVDRHGGGADAGGAADAAFRKLVAQHERRAVEVEFRVPDASAGLGQPELFARAEHLAVKVDRRRRCLSRRGRRTIREWPSKTSCRCDALEV